MNLGFKFKIIVLCTVLNQNTTEVALLHSKSNQVQVATKKSTQKELITGKNYSSNPLK